MSENESNRDRATVDNARYRPIGDVDIIDDDTRGALYHSGENNDFTPTESYQSYKREVREDIPIWRSLAKDDHVMGNCNISANASPSIKRQVAHLSSDEYIHPETRSQAIKDQEKRLRYNVDIAKVRYMLMRIAYAVFRIVFQLRRNSDFFNDNYANLAETIRRDVDKGMRALDNDAEFVMYLRSEQLSPTLVSGGWLRQDIRDVKYKDYVDVLKSYTDLVRKTKDQICESVRDVNIANSSHNLERFSQMSMTPRELCCYIDEAYTVYKNAVQSLSRRRDRHHEEHPDKRYSELRFSVSTSSNDELDSYKLRKHAISYLSRIDRASKRKAKCHPKYISGYKRKNHSFHTALFENDYGTSSDNRCVRYQSMCARNQSYRPRYYWLSTENDDNAPFAFGAREEWFYDNEGYVMASSNYPRENKHVCWEYGRHESLLNASTGKTKGHCAVGYISELHDRMLEKSRNGEVDGLDEDIEFYMNKVEAETHLREVLASASADFDEVKFTNASTQTKQPSAIEHESELPVSDSTQSTDQNPSSKNVPPSEERLHRPIDHNAASDSLRPSYDIKNVTTPVMSAPALMESPGLSKKCSSVPSITYTPVAPVPSYSVNDSREIITEINANATITRTTWNTPERAAMKPKQSFIATHAQNPVIKTTKEFSSATSIMPKIPENPPVPQRVDSAKTEIDTAKEPYRFYVQEVDPYTEISSKKVDVLKSPVTSRASKFSTISIPDSVYCKNAQVITKQINPSSLDEMNKSLANEDNGIEPVMLKSSKHPPREAKRPIIYGGENVDNDGLDSIISQIMFNQKGVIVEPDIQPVVTETTHLDPSFLLCVQSQSASTSEESLRVISGRSKSDIEQWLDSTRDTYRSTAFEFPSDVNIDEPYYNARAYSMSAMGSCVSDLEPTKHGSFVESLVQADDMRQVDVGRPVDMLTVNKTKTITSKTSSASPTLSVGKSETIEQVETIASNDEPEITAETETMYEDNYSEQLVETTEFSHSDQRASVRSSSLKSKSSVAVRKSSLVSLPSSLGSKKSSVRFSDHQLGKTDETSEKLPAKLIPLSEVSTESVTSDRSRTPKPRKRSFSKFLKLRSSLNRINKKQKENIYSEYNISSKSVSPISSKSLARSCVSNTASLTSRDSDAVGDAGKINALLEQWSTDVSEVCPETLHLRNANFYANTHKTTYWVDNAIDEPKPTYYGENKSKWKFVVADEDVNDTEMSLQNSVEDPGQTHQVDYISGTEIPAMPHMYVNGSEILAQNAVDDADRIRYSQYISTEENFAVPHTCVDGRGFLVKNEVKETDQMRNMGYLSVKDSSAIPDLYVADNPQRIYVSDTPDMILHERVPERLKPLLEGRLLPYLGNAIPESSGAAGTNELTTLGYRYRSQTLHDNVSGFEKVPPRVTADIPSLPEGNFLYTQGYDETACASVINSNIGAIDQRDVYSINAEKLTMTSENFPESINAKDQWTTPAPLQVYALTRFDNSNAMYCGQASAAAEEVNNDGLHSQTSRLQSSVSDVGIYQKYSISYDPHIRDDKYCPAATQEYAVDARNLSDGQIIQTADHSSFYDVRSAETAPSFGQVTTCKSQSQYQTSDVMTISEHDQYQSNVHSETSRYSESYNDGVDFEHGRCYHHQSHPCHHVHQCGQLSPKNQDNNSSATVTSVHRRNPERSCLSPHIEQRNGRPPYIDSIYNYVDSETDNCQKIITAEQDPCSCYTRYVGQDENANNAPNGFTVNNNEVVNCICCNHNQNILCNNHERNAYRNISSRNCAHVDNDYKVQHEQRHDVEKMLDLHRRRAALLEYIRQFNRERDMYLRSVNRSTNGRNITNGGDASKCLLVNPRVNKTDFNRHECDYGGRSREYSNKIACYPEKSERQRKKKSLDSEKRMIGRTNLAGSVVPTYSIDETDGDRECFDIECSEPTPRKREVHPKVLRLKWKRLNEKSSPAGDPTRRESKGDEKRGRHYELLGQANTLAKFVKSRLSRRGFHTPKSDSSRITVDSEGRRLSSFPDLASKGRRSVSPYGRKYSQSHNYRYETNAQCQYDVNRQNHDEKVSRLKSILRNPQNIAATTRNNTEYNSGGYQLSPTTNVSENIEDNLKINKSRYRRLNKNTSNACQKVAHEVTHDRTSCLDRGDNSFLDFCSYETPEDIEVQEICRKGFTNESNKTRRELSIQCIDSNNGPSRRDRLEMADGANDDEGINVSEFVHDRETDVAIVDVKRMYQPQKAMSPGAVLEALSTLSDSLFAPIGSTRERPRVVKNRQLMRSNPKF